MREEFFRHSAPSRSANTPAACSTPRHVRGDRSPDCPNQRDTRQPTGEGIAPSPSASLPRAPSAPRFPLPTALDHILGDPVTRTREAALPWHELFERQEQRLAHHARTLGLPTDWQPPAHCHAMPGGAEHHLWKGHDGRIYKMTRDDHFGQVPCYNPSSETGWENFAAAPADYLERLTLMNETFGDDLRVEGLRCGHTVAIATSQPLRKPARRRRPHPRTLRRIEAFMEQRGFVNLGFAAWYHPAKKLMVTDATPDNFIDTPRGLKPLDLMICRARGKLLRVLQKKIASGQPNDEVRLKGEGRGVKSEK